MTFDLKFEDCRLCRFRRQPATCAECDRGELFEERGRAPLNFSEEVSYRSLFGEDSEVFIPSHSIFRHLNELCEKEADLDDD